MTEGVDGNTSEADDVDALVYEPDDVDVPVYEPDDVDLSDPQYYVNRELSELAFQRRVLHEARDERNPPLERVRFLAIFTRNVDEFVMKRVGGLKQQIEAGVTERSVDGRTPKEQWEAVLDELGPMLSAQTEVYRTAIEPALAEAGISILSFEDLDEDQRAAMRSYFEESVLPTLTPLAFDPAHPFPFISNRSLSLAVMTRRPDEDLTFTRVKIPPNLPRLVTLEAGSEYVPVESIVKANLDLLFPNVEVVDASLFRLTRNAEVGRDEEVAEDLIEMIEDVLEQRRFATGVRLEVEEGIHERALDTLTTELALDDREVFERRGPIDYRGFEALCDLDRPDLSVEPWEPRPHPGLAVESERLADGVDPDDFFARIRERDRLLHHPYHDFTATVQRFIEEAARDPKVLAVKAAIYRTASDSAIIESLIDAAENGKQVAVMVELKARFDEQNNLEWVRTLEEHGIHVAYGTIGLKTHTKTALVVREEDDGVRLYSHVGTGNYHSETAKGYVDLGLLTADRDVGQDLAKVFHFFTGPALDESFRKLLIAPVTMRQAFTEAIRREAQHARAGNPARIVVKVNGLEDPAIVEELYRASTAGVDVDLIVRDICRLRPDIEGVSENVSVYSLVGRFLEHSRVFYFENGGDPEYYLGSADWMTRNLDNRVEAVTPVEDTAIRRQLKFVLELAMADNRRVWEMDEHGTYTQRRPAEDEDAIDTQAVLMDVAERAASTEDTVVGMPGPYPVDGDLLVGDPAIDAEARAAPEPEADGGLPPTLLAYPDAWYVPDSDHYDYAVRTPEGDRIYRKTASGAAAVVERSYGSGPHDGSEETEGGGDAPTGSGREPGSGAGV